MYSPHDEKLQSMIQPGETVLDIDGWACPFNRANFVLDAGPYETRGYYAKVGLPASQGGAREFFTRETWIQRDICDHTPFPFADKSLDWVICSHTLEDIREPLWVCSEMRRIGKRGYIEVPSRLAETSRGWEDKRTAGLSHHRWLIEIVGSHVRFLQKPHLIHRERRFTIPPSRHRSLRPEETVQWLFWSDTITWEEVTIHGLDNIGAELESFVKKHYAYPSALLAWDRLTSRTVRFADRVTAAVARRVGPRR